MIRNFAELGRKLTHASFARFMKPARKILKTAPPLASNGDRPLQMTFEDQLNALVYFHLEEHSSGRDLIQALEDNDFARHEISPKGGIQKSSFFEALGTRGLEHLLHVYNGLRAEASTLLPKDYAHLGDLQAIDGSLIDATLSMAWAEYRDGSKKAKVHLGFDIHRGVPSRVVLSEGKADERPFVSQLLESGQTGVMDRYYQCHRDFDGWQTEGKHFICRIRANTRRTELQRNPVPPRSPVFCDAVCLLGTKGQNQTEQPVRVVGYRVGKKSYWVATDRHDLCAQDVALAYKLRWNIEIFFGWWKRHLKVYHLISRSRHGLMVQILAGLITYLLLAIYCHEQYGEKVSILRVRELRHKIQNEAAQMDAEELLPPPGEIQPGGGLATART
jgi:Transposase DDE domain